MPRTSGSKPNILNENLKQNATNTFKQSTALTETVKMISRGILPNIPSEIVIKAIQRKDKKKLLISEVDDILLSLLQSSIVSPIGFNVYNLLSFESEYLLYRLRILTYGPTNTFKHSCPHCKEINDIDMNLNDIPILDIPDNFKLIFNITLPISGHTLKCKLLTEGEKIAINKKAKELKEATGNENINIDMLWESRVIGINGNDKLAPIEISQYLDEMNDYDSEYFMEYYMKYEGNYGLQTKLSYTCDKCGRYVETEIPPIYTFFRPTITLPDTF